MKSYDELKAEMETIQQQMAEAKKNERTNALKEVKRLCKEFGFTAGMLKGLLAEGKDMEKKIFTYDGYDEYLYTGLQGYVMKKNHKYLSKNIHVLV